MAHGRAAARTQPDAGPCLIKSTFSSVSETAGCSSGRCARALGHGGEGSELVPRRVNALVGKRVVQMATGYDYTAVLAV